MTLRYLFRALSGALAAVCLAPAAGVEELHRLDLLPRFRHSVRVAAFSSYDRTGGNDDGFSGKYSFIRKEGDGLVIAEMNGPGVIYRIWTPTPTAHPMEFYFDGESTPRIRLPFRELFTGDHAPFLKPVVGSGAGGYFSYLPLPYAKSCKVVVRGPRVQFYQINYATYPAGYPVRTYSPEIDTTKARQLFSQPGSDISGYLLPSAAAPRVLRARKTLAAGARAPLFEIAEPGRLLALRIGPAAAFAGKDRRRVLRIYWDGDSQPAVNVPAGDLFGYAWGTPAMKSLVLGTAGETNYLYFPMPFDKSARVELVDEGRSGSGIAVDAEAVFAPAPRTKDEGRFYAFWRRENPTTPGKPFTFVETAGRGHIVGAILQAQGKEPGGTGFFEGDDQVTLDGELTIHGTGSEDAFNGGWYDVPGRWYSRISFPLSGCLGYHKPLGRTGAYRFFLTEAYAFRKSARFTIEHGPTDNAHPTDYTGVVFLYSERRPTFDAALPPLAARRVDDPNRVIFTPGWAVPIDSFSFQNAMLAKRTGKFAGQDARYLSLVPQGEDMFGSHQVTFVLDVPAAGRYRISVEAIRGPSQGIIQIAANDLPAGTAADLYAPEQRRSEPVPLATLDLEQGPNVVTFRIVGKNPKAATGGLDLVTIICTRE